MCRIRPIKNFTEKYYTSKNSYDSTHKRHPTSWNLFIRVYDIRLVRIDKHSVELASAL